MPTRGLHIAIASILLCLVSYSLRAQSPVAYNSLKNTSMVGYFAFDSLDCSVVQEKVAFFYYDAPLELTFKVLVSPSGDVKYVRPPYMAPELKEVRLACVSALFQFVFSPVADERGDRWFEARLIPQGEDTTTE